MTRVAAALGLFLGVAIILSGSPEAEAKGNSWIVTGGALGEQAVHVGFWRFDDEVEDPPGSDAVFMSEAPGEVPSGAFELYLFGSLEHFSASIRAGRTSGSTRSSGCCTTSAITRGTRASGIAVPKMGRCNDTSSSPSASSVATMCIPIQ